MAEAEVIANREAGTVAVPAIPLAEAAAPSGKTNLERILELREKPDETLLESTDKRCALLLHMIKEMRAAGAVCDDTVLQLTMYLLVNLDNPGFDYEFYLDKDGPNCRNLQKDINALRSDLIYNERHRHGWNLLVLPKGEDFLRHFPLTLERYRPHVATAVNIAGSRPFHELMYLVTAMFLMQTGKGKSMSQSEAADYYLSLRRLSDRNAVEKAVVEAQALLSKGAAGGPAASA